MRQPATPVISALGALGQASQGDIIRPGVFSAINWREGHIDANNHKSHRRAWRTRRDVFWISPAGARAVLPLSAAATASPARLLRRRLRSAAATTARRLWRRLLPSAALERLPEGASPYRTACASPIAAIELQGLPMSAAGGRHAASGVFAKTSSGTRRLPEQGIFRKEPRHGTPARRDSLMRCRLPF